jgi:cytoskeletal protein CcmA (bactofilin family)
MWTAALLALLLFVLAAPSAAAFEHRAGPAVAVAAGETVDDDLVATGTEITVAGHITGDLYAFGRSLTVADTAQIDGDIIGAAQTVVVDGTVGGSVRTAGQVVRLERHARVDGGAVAAGQDVTVDGAVGRGLAAAAQRVQIGGTVGKDVRASVERLTVLPAARIAGDLLYTGREEATIPSDAVGGRVQYQAPAEPAARPRTDLSGLWWFMRGLWLIGNAVVGVLLIRLFPRLREAARSAMAAQAGVTFIAGIVALVVLPVLAVALLLTFVGIPLALVTIVGYGGSLYVGWLLLAYVVGVVAVAAYRRVQDGPARAAESLAAPAEAPEWLFLLGLGVLFVLGLIPFLGGFIGLLGAGMGLGAVLVVLSGAIRVGQRGRAPAPSPRAAAMPVRAASVGPVS